MALDIYKKSAETQFAKLESLIQEAVEHPVRQSWLRDSNIAYQYYQGNQWTTAEKKVLAIRQQADIVYNEIEPVVERTIGQYRRQSMSTTLVGRNAPQDDDSANALSDIIRFVDQDNDYPHEEKEGVRSSLVSGFGVIECGVEKGPFGPRIFLQQEDEYTIFPDPYCRRYDWNDFRGGARYIMRSKWMHIDEAKDRWPDHSAALENALGMQHPARNVTATLDPDVLFTMNAHFFDREKRLIRPIEIWFKQRVEEEVIVTPYGVFGSETDEKLRHRALRLLPGAKEEVRPVDRMYVAVIAGDRLIQKATPSPYTTSKFPFIPIYAHRQKDGQPVGHVWRLIDPNREINARRSRALYMLNNRQAIYERGAVRDKGKMADELATADGQIEIEPGFMQKFAMRENVDIGQANLQMLQEAKTELQHLAGEDYLQPSGEMRSGRGAAQQQLPYHLSQVDIFDNITKSRRIKTLLVVDYIKQYFDEEMVFQITDDEEKAKTITVTSDTFSAIKERTYDVVLKESPNHDTLHDEQFETIATVLPQVAQYGPVWGKILISMSQIKDKAKILEQLSAMEKAAPPEPKVSISLTWHEMTPAEKAAWAGKLGMPDLAKAVTEEARKPASDLAHEADIAKTLIREGVKSGTMARQQHDKQETELVAARLQRREQDQTERLTQQEMELQREQAQQEPTDAEG